MLHTEAWERADSARIDLKDKLSRLVRSSLDWLRSSVVTIITTLGVGLVCAAAIMPLTGFRPHLWGSPQHTHKGVVAAPKPPSTPQIVAAAPKCKEPAEAAGVLFTTCPSFTLDYSKQKTGRVATNIFNIYQGPPIANEEAEFYTNSPRNVRVADGSLMFEARNEPRGGYRYTSARIDTKHKKDFLYGKFVIRAKLPAGVGTWPAIWMLPSDPKYASLSPANDPNRYANDGEIDIVEGVGWQPNVVYSVAHSLAYSNDGVDRTYFNTVVVPGSTTAYHDYEMDWTPARLTFSVDGKVYFVYNKQPGASYYSWPYDQPFYLVMNLAMGGSWAGQDRADFPLDGVDSSALPASMNIQSIRYYSYIGPK